MEIKFIEAEQLRDNKGVIEEIVEIYFANNFLYSPTLAERFKADDDNQLIFKLRDRIITRIEEGYNFYLIYEDGKLVGFNNHKIGMNTIKGLTYLALEIGTTCIDPYYQNRGFGKELYALIDREAVERYHVDAIIRTTWSTNTRQVHLYGLYGFEVYIRKYDYYGFEGVDSLSFYKVM